MGVTGLWKLVEPSGKPVPLETLENKILAVDISIWLHQVIKGFQDANGATLQNAHLLGLFHRLCKLLFYKIRPVFVFDGGVPDLKRETIFKRRQTKSKYNAQADEMQHLLLQALAKEKIVQLALGPSTSELLQKSPLKDKLTRVPVESKDDIFKLPPIVHPYTGEPIAENELSKSSGSGDDSFDDKTAESVSSRHSNLNINSIDVTNAKFKALPADIRHDILTEIRETRKQSSWGRLHELPVDSDEFSGFQMKRLIKRRQVQISLETAEKEMGGKSLSMTDLERLLTEEGIVDVCSKSAKRIASDEHSYYFYCKDVNEAKNAIDAPTSPKMPRIQEEEEEDNQDEELEEVIEISENNSIDTNTDEMDEDLQKAIQMSLQDIENNKCNEQTEVDPTTTTTPEVKMCTEQKKAFGNAAKSLARAYMIEYGGMNSDDVANLVDYSVTDEPTFKYNQSLLHPETPSSSNCPIIDKDMNSDDVESISSGADSDFIDVPDIDELPQSSSSSAAAGAASSERIKMNPSPTPSSMDESKDFRLDHLTLKPNLEVIIDTNHRPVDDLFDDIFTNRTKEIEDKKIVTDQMKSPDKSKKKSLNNILDDLNTDFKNVLEKGISLNLNDISEDEKPLIKSIQLEAQTINPNKSKLYEILNDLDSNLKAVTEIGIQLNTDSTVKNTEKLNRDEVIEILDDNDQLIKTPTKQTNLDSFIQHPIPSSRPEIDTTSPPSNILKPFFRKNSPIKVQSPDQDGENPKTDESTKPTKPNKVTEIGIQFNIDSTTENTEKLNRDEIIEILDDNDQLIKTPTKQTNLDSFIQRCTPPSTSHKSQSSEIDKTPPSPPPNIPKPFYRKSSPKKVQTPEKISSENKSKVIKQLYQDELNGENPKIDESTKPTKPDETDTRVIDILRSQPIEELQEMATAIRNEKKDIEFEQNKLNRLGVSVSERMRTDCQELLKLFGIPYIVAPMEAEAQCAFLNEIQLTDGTITDDSDIWLFGGKTVYKNFFNQDKTVMEFRVENIERHFSIDRDKLIQLSILVGSDYTTGIAGIGAVTALEILATFKATTTTTTESSDKTIALLSGLRKFRDWHKNNQNFASNIKLRNKLKNISLSDEFPSTRVVDAYLNPTIDTNREPFIWGKPDPESIREFAKTRLGWTYAKTDHILLPVLNKLMEKKTQQTIRDYFQCQRVSNNVSVVVSKRVKKAIEQMAGNNDELEDNQQQIDDGKRKRNRGRSSTQATTTTTVQTTVKKGRKRGNVKSTLQNPATIVENHMDEPSVSGFVPNIPNPNPEIPQRIKNQKLLEANKDKAIELMKKLKTTKTSKRKK